MEQDKKKLRCLSVRDLSIEHFLTAEEDNGQDAISTSAISGFMSASNDAISGITFAVQNNAPKIPLISSSALVDSDNEESLDDTNDDCGQTRRAEFVVGDSDEFSRAHQSSGQVQKSISGRDEDRASTSRLLWQRHSLLNRSHALKAYDDHDDDYEGSRHRDTNENASCTCDKDKLVRASTSPDDGSTLTIGNNGDCLAINRTQYLDDDDDDDGEASFTCNPVADAEQVIDFRQSCCCNCKHEQQLAINNQPKVLIRIDDISSSSKAAEEYCFDNLDTVIADLNPQPPPPPSPLDSDAPVNLVRHKLRASLNPVDGLTAAGGLKQTGSISDNSYLNSNDRMALLERRQMEERLRNWKRSNKVIAHLRGNPFDLPIECLDKIEKLNLDGKLSQTDVNDETEATSGEQNNKQQRDKLQEEQLQNYATHLSHLYRKNQSLMDNNSDFRNLLYNIICCLLIQDEQVLSSASVFKMIDVIRTHLESATRYYSSAIMQLSIGQHTNVNTNPSNESRRKSSLGSLTSCSTSSNTSSVCQQQSKFDATGDRNTLHPGDAIASVDYSTTSGERRPKSADFRRISSVSYNDEQLINDLCDQSQSERTPLSVGSSGGGSSASESPWRYEELSSECKHQMRVTNRSLCNSSLDRQSNSTLVESIVHDSGIGTSTCRDEGRGDKRSLKQQLSNQDDHERRRLAWTGRQKLSYLSSDDCFTHLHTDDDSMVSEFLGKQTSDDKQQEPDASNIKSELEWTLNRLINLELRYTWLTSKDTLRRAIRKIGVPNEIRGKVWLILIDQMIEMRYDAARLLDEATKTINSYAEHQQADVNRNSSNSIQNRYDEFRQDQETDAILKQIDLDVNRTMPGHRLFDDGAEGEIKLRRILVAYSIHVNREIAYCQGFNFIVALLLSVFEGDEERALRGFICIVDHIFPSKFYFDHYLTGARADQFLLADFICDQLIKNPSTAERKMVEGVTSSITLNWFISLFHGAVPTLTRLIILDHFMLEGVKALFRFTMAILYLAFQVTPPSSCEVFNTIRITARDMYDIKLLLSIVEQIKLPKDSYFAIRRSFYMLQSSFNSDQFYMQSLSGEASRQCVANKPLSVQQMPGTKAPALSLISGSSIVSAMSDTNHFRQQLSNNGSSGSNGSQAGGPRICTSSNRSKVCVQNIGNLGRSHLKIMDANDRSNERSLMSPLRNCLVIGISNCGKSIIVARQSSRKNFKVFRDQGLTFYIHELSNEIFDGFYLEDLHMALILTNLGEICKIDTSKCFTDNQTGSAETLMLKSLCNSGARSSSTATTGGDDNERIKLRLASLDPLTKLLWVCAECETVPASPRLFSQQRNRKSTTSGQQLGDPIAARRRALKANNPFMFDSEDYPLSGQHNFGRANYQRKILIIDVMTFDMFSAFTVHQGFGEILKLRTCLVSFCQLANPMSNQFSSRIVKIGPTGHYEHQLSFSDVVDFMINLSDSHKHQNQHQQQDSNNTITRNSKRYSSIRKLFNRSVSLDCDNSTSSASSTPANRTDNAGTLTRYYRSLIKSHSNAGERTSSNTNVDTKSTPIDPTEKEPEFYIKQTANDEAKCKTNHTLWSILDSSIHEIQNSLESDFLPVNMTFIFRNGKIALFEFTRSYAIHTRESQLDRYDYSRVIDVVKSDDDFIITILTVLGKLIKVVI